MDCFSVSVTQGLCQRQWDNRVWLMALLFGLFQGGMPLLGYLAGVYFSAFVTRYAPWIALALLGFIGGKMIVESLRKSKEEETRCANWKLLNLILLAIATSIDALATGVLFVTFPERLWLGVIVIAAGSFLLSLVGYVSGVYIGKKLRFNAGLWGGIILVFIGIKICLEGLCL